MYDPHYLVYEPHPGTLRLTEPHTLERLREMADEIESYGWKVHGLVQYSRLTSIVALAAGRLGNALPLPPPQYSSEPND
ncbi:MAG: hypothetical protein ACREDH_15000 [Methylocella sp.]